MGLRERALEAYAQWQEEQARAKAECLAREQQEEQLRRQRETLATRDLWLKLFGEEPEKVDEYLVSIEGLAFERKWDDVFMPLVACAECGGYVGLNVYIRDLVGLGQAISIMTENRTWLHPDCEQARMIRDHVPPPPAPDRAASGPKRSFAERLVALLDERYEWRKDME